MGEKGKKGNPFTPPPQPDPPFKCVSESLSHARSALSSGIGKWSTAKANVREEDADLGDEEGLGEQSFVRARCVLLKAEAFIFLSLCRLHFSQMAVISRYFSFLRQPGRGVCCCRCCCCLPVCLPASTSLFICVSLTLSPLTHLTAYICLSALPSPTDFPQILAAFKKKLGELITDD